MARSAHERGRVAMVGRLQPQLAEELVERYGAVELDQLTDTQAADVEVAVTSGVFGVRAEHLDRMTGLGAVVTFGVGYDRTDVAEAARRGVAVANTPDVLTDCVADLAVGLVIDTLRGITAADRHLRRGDWAAGRPAPLGRRVSGTRIGIVGLGRIGSAIADRLVPFGAKISYHNRSERPDVPYRYVADPVLLAARSDVLVVAAAGGEGSAGLVDEVVLDALGPRGFLVNVARGSVVDEAALVAALEQGRIAGAGLDVFAQEPQVPRALLTRDDVVLLPHIGSGTEETRAAMTRLTLDNVAQHLHDGTLLTPVPAP